MDDGQRRTRDERLAAALRENLRKRKARARGLAAGAAPPADAAGPAPADDEAQSDSPPSSGTTVPVR